MEIELITNQKTWAANTIAELYKSRWDIEIFFREIKQCLNIKSFIGTSKNAVMIQIWSALITILLLKTLKSQAKYNWHLSNLVAFIRLNTFVKIDLHEWLNHPFKPSKPPPKHNGQFIQGVLFWKFKILIRIIRFFWAIFISSKRLGHYCYNFNNLLVHKALKCTPYFRVKGNY